MGQWEYTNMYKWRNVVTLYCADSVLDSIYISRKVMDLYSHREDRKQTDIECLYWQRGKLRNGT